MTPNPTVNGQRVVICSWRIWWCMPYSNQRQLRNWLGNEFRAMTPSHVCGFVTLTLSLLLFAVCLEEVSIEKINTISVHHVCVIKSISCCIPLGLNCMLSIETRLIIGIINHQSYLRACTHAFSLYYWWMSLGSRPCHEREWFNSHAHTTIWPCPNRTGHMDTTTVRISAPPYTVFTATATRRSQIAIYALRWRSLAPERNNDDGRCVLRRPPFLLVLVVAAAVVCTHIHMVEYVYKKMWHEICEKIMIVASCCLCAMQMCTFMQYFCLR